MITLTELEQNSGFSVAMIVLGEIKNDYRVIKMAESLSELGLDVHIFGVSGNPSLSKQVTGTIGSVKTTIIPDISSDLPDSSCFWDIWKYKKQSSLTILWPLISRFNPDIIQTNDFDTLEIGGIVVERFRKTGKQVKWVHDIHNYTRGMDFENEEMSALARLDEENHILSPDLLLTVSEKISSKISGDYPLSNNPSVILSSPLRERRISDNNTIRSSLGLSTKEKLIVYCGNIDHSTGLLAVVDAISMMDGGTHLAIVSDCEERYLNDIEGLSDEKGCSDRIHTMSFVNPDEVANFIKDADVGIHPINRSTNSDFSLPKKVLEYVFAGLPVVTSDCQTISEFVKDWKIGEVFESGKPEEIVRALSKVISSPKKYSKNISEELLHLHSWEHNKHKIAESYFQMIEEISNNSGKERIFGEISGVENGLLNGWVMGLGKGYSKCFLEISCEGELVSSVNLDPKKDLSRRQQISDKLTWKSILPNSHYDGKERKYSAKIRPWDIECESLSSRFSMGVKKPVSGEFYGGQEQTLRGKVSVFSEMIDSVEVDVFYNQTYICSHMITSPSPGTKTWSREFIVPLPRVFHDNKLRRFRIRFSEGGGELEGSPKLVKFPRRRVQYANSINQVQIENLMPGGGEWGVPRGVENQGKFGLRLEKYCFSIGERISLECSGIRDQELDISLFRIGYYGGKKCRPIRSWKNVDCESGSLVKFKLGTDFLPGTYHIVAKDKEGKRQFVPFCLFSPDSNSRILAIHPNIANHLFHTWKDLDFEKISYLEGFENIEDSLTKIQIANRIEESRSGSYPFWVLNATHWLERMGLCYTSISDDELHHNPSIAMDKDVIVFLGNSRFWTEEIHRIVGHQLSTGGKVAILGTGMGEQIVDLDKERMASLNFSRNEYRSGVPLSENWIETNSPVIFDGFVKEPIEAAIITEEEKVAESIVIKGCWDTVKVPKNAEKSSLIKFEGNNVSAGNFSIETCKIIFENNAQILHGGFESWSESLDNHEISQILYSFLTGKKNSKDNSNTLIDEAAAKIAIDKWGAIPGVEGKKNRKLVRRVCILTALWKRNELSKLVLSHYRRMAERMSGTLDIELVAVGSDEESERIADELNVEYVHHPNNPLSEKWGRGLEECMNFNPDVVMTVGSDDLISDSTLVSLCQKVSEGRMVVGIKDMYIIDQNDRTLNYWRGYSGNRDNETIGMARCYSKEILEKIDFNLWKGHQVNKGLDRIATSVVSQYGNFPVNSGAETAVDMNGVGYLFGHIGYLLEEIGGFAVDIKTEENISKLSDYGVMTSSSLESSINLLRESLGNETVDELLVILGDELSEG